MPSSPVVRGEAPGEVTAQSDSSSSNSESGGTGIISVDQTKVEVPPLRVTPSSFELSEAQPRTPEKKIGIISTDGETEVKPTYSDLTLESSSSQKSPTLNQEQKTIPPIIIVNEDGDIITDKEVMRDTYQRIRQELCDLSSQKDWIIEGYNVSDAFRKYQITNIDKLVDGEIFQFSSDVEAILSLHHIMFVDLTKMKKPLYIDIDDRKWRASVRQPKQPIPPSFFGEIMDEYEREINA